MDAFLDQYLEAIAQAPDDSERDTITQCEYERIVKRYPNPESRKKVFAEHRHSLKKAHGEEEGKRIGRFLTLTRDENKRISDRYEADVAGRQEDRIPILDPDHMISIFRELITLNSYIDITIGLAGLTGRRESEIGVTADFQRIDDNYLLFAGQNKKKKGEIAIPYPIPTLADSAEVLEHFNRLCEKRPNDRISWQADSEEKREANRQYHDRTSKQFRRKMDKHFGMDCYKLHDLRAMYATLTYRRFATPSMSESYYFSQTLGHRKNDLSTQHSYQKFYIPDQKWGVQDS